ncbi:hypothetical protein [Leifsonia sp. NPDC080035]|uniref:DUF559 domain-containing protein n=1 Tax=Leifsonia sp. NPDC080035 TaxID=3143936 RepID=A0AAU7GEP9_9MICO
MPAEHVFSTTDGRRNGLTPAQLRSRAFLRPIRGVRISAESDEFEARLMAFAVHRSWRDFVFSHSTAARLLGIPLPLYCGRDVHVSVPAGARAPAISGYVGHALTRWSVTEVGGFPVTSPAQTWLDLATMLHPEDLVIAGDHLVGAKAPLATVEELRAAIAASAGRRGSGRARSALDRVRIGSESPGETRLRLLIADAGLPEPVLNHNILDPGGAFIARVDLAYPERRVALEYEGDIHRVDRRTWMNDISRRERVEDLGWRMIRITADDLHRPAPLLIRIRRLLSTRPTRSSK